MENKDKKISWKQILCLQGVVVIYTISSMMAKFAAKEPAMSFRFIMFYGCEIVFLGIYAIFWQQMIKKIELSVAYANRAMALVWSIIWAVIIFKENITWQNIVGILLVMAGIFIINTGGDK